MTLFALPLALLLQNPAPAQGPVPATPAQGQNVPAGSKFALPTAGEKEQPFSKPFQVFGPKTDFELSDGWRAIFRNANEMYRLWSESATRGFDEEGRPTTREGHFATLRERLEKSLYRQGGMIRVYRMDENNAARRRASIFGSLFVTPRQDAVDLLRFLPYEPVTTLRQEAIEFSKPFLKAQVHERKTDAQGKPGEPVYFVDAAPWIDLSRSRETKDRLLALDVLTEIARARPLAMRASLPYLKRWFPDLLRSKSEPLRERAKTFMTVLEPEARFPKDVERSVEYFGRVYKKLYPPVRLHKGRCELYPSPELDAVVAAARDLLRDRSATKMESRVVRKSIGTFDMFGLRLLRIPLPLEKAGLSTKMLLTTLNGQPIESREMLLSTIEKAVARGQTRFVVEWVTEKGELRVLTYVRMPKED